MLAPRRVDRIVLMVALGIVVACRHRKAVSGGEVAAADSESETAAAAPAKAAAESTPPVAEVPDTMTPLTDADLDRYRRGMTAELAYVKAKIVSYKAAKSATDTLTTAIALNDPAARDSAAAAGAGLDGPHWRALSRAVDAVLGRRQTAALASRAQQEIDSSGQLGAAEADKNLATLQGAQAYAGLPPDNVKLVLAHAVELDSLRLTPEALAFKAMSDKPAH